MNFKKQAMRKSIFNIILAIYFPIFVLIRMVEAVNYHVCWKYIFEDYIDYMNERLNK